MFIYFLLLFLYALIYLGFGLNKTNKNKLFFSVLLAVGLIVVYGLRSSSVGVDTIQYQVRYNDYASLLKMDKYKTEFGFNYINLFFNKLHFPWQLYLIFTSTFIVVVIIYFFYRYSANIYFSFFLFVTIGLFTMSLSGLRQSLAICFCLITYMLFDSPPGKKKNKLKIIIGIILWLFSISIHNSAIIFVLFFIVKWIKLSKKGIVFLLIVSLASFFYGRYLLLGFQNFFPQRYQFFNLSSNYHINPLLVVINLVIPLFCAFYIHPRCGQKYFDRNISLLFWFAIFNLLFVCMSIFNNQIGRLQFYFSISLTILIPTALKNVRNEDKNFLYFLISFACIVFFYLGTKDGTLKIDNYQFFWETI